MSGMRTHMEIAGCMLATYKTELAFMPGLSELLQECSDAYVYGAAYPDWTHATEYAQTAKGVVDTIQEVAGDIPGIGALILLLELAFHDIFDVLNNPPPPMDDEMEHWRPYLKRLSLLLRQEAANEQPTGDVARRVAFLLGISCHQAEDNAFHFRGEIGATPELGWLATRSLNPADTLPRFHVFGMQDAAILARRRDAQCAARREGSHGDAAPLLHRHRGGRQVGRHADRTLSSEHSVGVGRLSGARFLVHDIIQHHRHGGRELGVSQRARVRGAGLHRGVADLVRAED